MFDAGQHGAAPQADPITAACAGVPPQRLDAEQRLYACSTSAATAYLIVSGIVRFERVTAAGVRRIIRLAGRGDLIGQEALLGQAYRDDAVTCTAVRLCRVPASALADMGLRGACMPMALMLRWQNTLDETAFWSTELTSGPARRRVLQLLARLKAHHVDEGLVWLPKRDQMADMLNITVETCSRVLSVLRRDGVLALVAPRQARLDEARLGAALAQSNL